VDSGSGINDPELQPRAHRTGQSHALPSRDRPTCADRLGDGDPAAAGEADVIVGQIHGADAISSIPFVLLHDNGGAIGVAVKQQQSGPQATSVSLLTNVPLGSPIDFTISDNGDGSLAFTATADGRTATASPPVPAAFRGAPVRFQAGAYQQADSTTGSAAPDDGARVTFHTLTVSP
jgi:hypothetical protein